ncbi:MAG: hypothetical protein GX454_12495 [Brooklawnia sp.]|nr:hypothetical protein [Brooklawnia sp.]
MDGAAYSSALARKVPADQTRQDCRSVWRLATAAELLSNVAPRGDGTAHALSIEQVDHVVDLGDLRGEALLDEVVRVALVAQVMGPARHRCLGRG